MLTADVKATLARMASNGSEIPRNTAQSPLMTAAEVEAVTTLDIKTIDRLMAQERFPPARKLSDRRRAWERDAFARWCSDPLG